MAVTATLIARFERHRRWQIIVAILIALGLGSLLLQEHAAFIQNHPKARFASAFAAAASTPSTTTPLSTPKQLAAAVLGGSGTGRHSRPGAGGSNGSGGAPEQNLVAAGNGGSGGESGEGVGAAPPAGDTGSGGSNGPSPTLLAFNAPGAGGGAVPGIPSTPGGGGGTSSGGSGTGGNPSGGQPGGSQPGGGNTGPTPGAVPEPESWALMLVGLGIIGVMFRRKKIGIQRA